MCQPGAIVAVMKSRAARTGLGRGEVGFQCNDVFRFPNVAEQRPTSAAGGSSDTGGGALDCAAAEHAIARMAPHTKTAATRCRNVIIDQCPIL